MTDPSLTPDPALTPDDTAPVPDRDAEPPALPGAVQELHRRERRRLLTEDAIVATALRIVASQGIAAVTMRRVAGELNVAASSLYPHVGSRERLLDLAVREVLSGGGPLPETGDWRADLRRHFIDLRDRLAAHADLAQHALFAAVEPTSPEDLNDLETVLGRLGAEGLDPEAALTAWNRLMLYTVADVLEDWQRRQRVDDAAAVAWLGTFTAYVDELPDERFPRLRAHAPALVAPEPGRRFLAGLDLLLDGLAAALSRPDGSRR